jgi:hypothetical protein
VARHADFGAVVSITEELANEILSSVANNLQTLPFNVPIINVAGVIVNINGSLKLLAPTVVLHERP